MESLNEYFRRNYYLYNKPRDEELLKIFPEAREIIAQKIDEYQSKRRELIDKIRSFRKKVKATVKTKNENDVSLWFWEYAIPKYLFTPDIITIDRRLTYLKQLNYLLHRKGKAENNNWRDRIERARVTPLFDIAEPYLQKVRRVGNRVTACCPLHEDNTPSFFIYLNENRFHCYGCGAHGDTISFVMRKENLTFLDAVRRLTT